MKPIEKLLLDYIKTNLDAPSDIVTEFSDDKWNDRQIKFMVNVAKTDKNSNEYDPKYAKFFKRKKGFCQY